MDVLKKKCLWSTYGMPRKHSWKIEDGIDGVCAEENVTEEWVEMFRNDSEIWSVRMESR